MNERSALLDRIERHALLLAVGGAIVALVVPGGGPTVAAGVFGGALLSAVSYLGIKRGVNGLTSAMVGGASARAGSARALTMLVGRYALLALIAYVMISRLRLSPLGLLLGVSVIPAAALIAALAGERKS